MKMMAYELDILDLINKKYMDLFNIDNIKHDDYCFMVFDTVLNGFIIGTYKKSFRLTSLFASFNNSIIDKDTVITINDYPTYYKLNREDSDVLVKRIMDLLNKWFNMGTIKQYSVYYIDTNGSFKEVCIDIDSNLFNNIKDFNSLDDFLRLIKEVNLFNIQL